MTEINKVKKMGRPLKSGEPKNTSLHLRLTQSENAKIIKCAEKLKVSKTEVIMQGIEMLLKNPNS